MAEYYSLDEVARKLGKSEDQVREMVSNGELRAFRDAGSLKFRKADIDEMAPAEEGIAVGAEPTTEPEQDELLFLIDEEGASADPDDLTLIGEGEETPAAVAAEEPEGMFSEEIGLAGDQHVDADALTAVIEPVSETPTAQVDLFAEAQAEMAPAAGEAEAATVPFGRAARLRQLQEAAQARSPFMSVLLVVAFIVLAFAGVVIYNSFVTTAKPPILEWLPRGG
jgi:excisionase family DNA binding protein